MSFLFFVVLISTRSQDEDELNINFIFVIAGRFGSLQVTDQQLQDSTSCHSWNFASQNEHSERCKWQHCQGSGNLWTIYGPAFGPRIFDFVSKVSNLSFLQELHPGEQPPAGSSGTQDHQEVRNPLCFESITLLISYFIWNLVILSVIVLFYG